MKFFVDHWGALLFQRDLEAGRRKAMKVLWNSRACEGDGIGLGHHRGNAMDASLLATTDGVVVSIGFSRRAFSRPFDGLPRDSIMILLNKKRAKEFLAAFEKAMKGPWLAHWPGRRVFYRHGHHVRSHRLTLTAHLFAVTGGVGIGISDLGEPLGAKVSILLTEKRAEEFLAAFENAMNAAGILRGPPRESGLRDDWWPWRRP